MKRIFATLTLCAFVGLGFAQNAQEAEDVFTPSYQTFVHDSLEFMMEKYWGSYVTRGGNIEDIPHMTETHYVADVDGNITELRQVVNKVCHKLEQLPYLQAYTERIDEANDLRGRYILKLKPEGQDTLVYFIFKYTPQLVTFKLSRNAGIDFSKSVPVKTTSKNDFTDRYLSCWKELQHQFDFERQFVTDLSDQRYNGFWYQPDMHKDNPDIVVAFADPNQKEDVFYTDVYRLKLDKNEYNSDSFLHYEYGRILKRAGSEEGCQYGQKTIDGVTYHYATRIENDGRRELYGIAIDEEYVYYLHVHYVNAGGAVWAWVKNFERDDECLRGGKIYRFGKQIGTYDQDGNRKYFKGKKPKNKMAETSFKVE